MHTNIGTIAVGSITPPNLMTVNEVAQLLGVSRSTVYRMDRQNGPFNIFQKGRRVFIDSSDFNRYRSGRAREQTYEAAGDKSLPSVPNRGNRGQRELVLPERRLFVVFFNF